MTMLTVATAVAQLIQSRSGSMRTALGKKIDPVNLL